MVRVANRDCGQYIESLTEFKGSNLFSESKSKYYAVYSYGYHFPILLYVRADATTGDVSISGLTPEKPQNVIKARAIVEDFDAVVETPVANAGAPTPPSTGSTPPPPGAPANWKNPAGEVFAEAALVAQGWTPELLSANGYTRA